MLLSKIIDFLLPRYCVMCGRRLTVSEETICTHCNLELPRTFLWKDPWENDFAKMFWGCVPVKKAVAFITYHPNSDPANIVKSFKYHDSPKDAVVAGKLMAGELAAYKIQPHLMQDSAASKAKSMPENFFSDIDGIVPIPLSSKRKRERGYNQSDMLAKGIAMVTHLPVFTDCVRRKTFKISQTRLDYLQRMENIRGVFQLTDNASKLRNKHILLVDDVVTTGSTTSECANELLKIEGLTVSILSFCSAWSANRR